MELLSGRPLAASFFLLLCCCARPSGSREGFGEPVGIRFSPPDAGAPLGLEAAFAVSQGKDASAYVGGMATALERSLRQCPEAAESIRRGGSVRRFMGTLRNGKLEIPVASDPGDAECVRRGLSGSAVGGENSPALDVVIEIAAQREVKKP